MLELLPRLQIKLYCLRTSFPSFICKYLITRLFIYVYIYLLICLFTYIFIYLLICLNNCYLHSSAI